MPQINDEWHDQILEILDQFAEEFLFPMPNNTNFQLAKMRLTAFCGDSEWLIVFEEIAYSENNYDRFANFIHAYGNKLENSYLDPIHPFIFDELGNSLWNENGRFQLDKELGKEKITIQLNGQLRDVPLKIDSQSVTQPLTFLRKIADMYPDDVFLSRSELLAILGRDPNHLKLFVKWNEWHHPDLADDELPSEISCFQNLANALEKNDPDLADCPSDEWNSHWENWEYF